MTLEEAIKHAEEKAKCGGKCGEDHAQLAMWLKELQERRAAESEKRTEERTETHACDLRRYTFGNDEFNLEAAYHDCKLVFDGIADDDSFQESDTGLILYYANEIIYALHEALQGDDTNVLSNDCISRQAAISVIAKWMLEYGGEGEERERSALKQAAEEIKVLPSVQPERKTGKWLPDNRPGGGFWVCSCCKFPSEAFAANVLYKFCPNCGAYMGGDTE